MKKIIVEYLVSSQKTAILEDDKLIELLIEDNKNSKKVSNIYRGVVKKVILGIQACFVDIGFEKLAYLQLDKDSNIKAGQDILVQVNKEEVGTKGAKLNTEISLAGRYLVYIPTNDRITISNKILDEKERFRLKKIANSVSKGAKGLIIRTEAVGCTKEELEADINELKERYEEIIKEYKLGIGPKLLYKELDFSSKYIKDNVNEDIEKIVTNDKCKHDELKNILKELGLEAIFDGCIYDRLTDEEMAVGSIYHKTAIKNDENGTEAAAVTMILMEAMALLPEDDIVEMNMDHPFYFTISNTQTGLKLFEGCVYNLK